MSRMGNKPIALDPKVKFDVNGQLVKVTGPKGSLEFTMPEGISLDISEKTANVKRSGDDRFSKMKHGLTRSIVNSMVIGVSTGFKIELELVGVGYRAQVAGRKLTLNLGYSLPIEYVLPEGIDCTTPDQTHITLTGIDKQKIGQVAAIIRKFRVPDAYHGKGVRFVGEQISLKEGKKV